MPSTPARTTRPPLRAAAHRWRAAGRRLLPWARRKLFSRSRQVVIALSLLSVVIGVGSARVSSWWFSPALLVLPVLAGGMLARSMRALRALFGAVVVVLAADAVFADTGPGIVAAVVITGVFAYQLSRIRQQLGVQGMRGEQMLLELRDRLRTQGKLPTLPRGWASRVVLEQAGGSSFGGDFCVSALRPDGHTLEVALVDVSGKGIDAGTRALMLSGAFGGLLGSVPSEDFLGACNAYLRRQASGEGFVTAVHLVIDLRTGDYTVESAGHPPAVRFDAGSGVWRVTEAKGVVLGVVPDLRCAPEHGVLNSGDAVLLYTDGMIEEPGLDLDAGIDRLLGEAEHLVATGFHEGAPEMVRTLSKGHNDDCALVVIWRK
ncbi:MAG TPA: PP2C family protein-serine/threonine phosphatase [Streptosporangiaceae bacterium]|jgi:hypothetical protein